MSDVDFEEQNWQTTRRFEDEEPSGSKMTNLLGKLGVAKDSKKANYILIGVAVIFLLLTVYFIMSAI